MRTCHRQPFGDQSLGEGRGRSHAGLDVFPTVGPQPFKQVAQSVHIRIGRQDDALGKLMLIEPLTELPDALEGGPSRRHQINQVIVEAAEAF